MKATLTFGLECKSVQHATAIRDKCAEWLDEDPDVSVISTNSATDEQPFTVVGSIKGKPDQNWREVVLAADPEDARAKALAEDDKRTVVAVLVGDVPMVQAAA